MCIFESGLELSASTENGKAGFFQDAANGYLAVQCEAIAECATGENTVLESLCDLVTEKADCSEADFDTYVSTESLLPNKMGRQIASSLPQTGKVTVYQAGDILISNIRPYFKKIWYADQAGTCSGDVLVFRAKQPEWAGYLYSCLRNDSFFDFVMKGAKGTKMPRGDKKQMLTYEVSASPNQLVIGFMASALKHISTANKESEHLAALRDALLPKLMSGEVDVSKVNLTQLNSHLVADLSNWHWYRVVNRHIRQVETETWLCAPWLFCH